MTRAGSDHWDGPHCRLLAEGSEQLSPLDPHSLCTGLMGQPQPWMGKPVLRAQRVPSSPPCILSKSGQLLANHSR